MILTTPKHNAPHHYLLSMIFIFFLFTICNYYLNIDFIKFLSNACMAATIWGFGCYILLKANQSHIRLNLYFLFPLALMAISCLFNLTTTDYPTLLKTAGAWLMFGSAFLSTSKAGNSQKKFTKIIVIIMLSLPILIVYIDILLFNNVDRSSVFVNRNSAGFFCLTCSILLYIYFPNNKIFLPVYIVVTMITFVTQGLFLAVFCAFVFIFNNQIIRFIKRPNFMTIFVSIVLLLLSVVFSAYLSNLEIISRLTSSFTLFTNLITRHSIFDLAEVSYLDAIKAGGTPGDMSFLFRIKHWTDIITIYCSSDLITILFGFGADRMQYLTLVQMRPHNDHLRLLVEYGLFFYICFILAIIQVLKLVKKNNEKIVLIPIIASFLYMFTENLIDNFPALTILAITIGTLVNNTAIPDTSS